MPWDWYHEVAVWLSAIAIHAIVVRWCCVGMRKNRWREMYWMAYRWSFSFCFLYSLYWASGYRYLDAYLSFAFFDAVVIWPAATTCICGLVAYRLDLVDIKKGRALPTKTKSSIQQ